MINRTQLLFLLFILLCTNTYSQENRLTGNEFEIITGNWKGKLVYLDYQTGKPYEMPANLEIRKTPEKNSYLFLHKYPDEPSANSTDTVNISADGKLLEEELVTSVRNYPGNKNETEIVTEIKGNDGNDNKEALIRHTYKLSDTTFEIRKEVLFAGTDKWILRHTYAYTRMN